MPRASPISGVFQAGAGTYLLLGAVLAFGALIRFSGVDQGWFVYDQVRDATIPLGIVNDRNFLLMAPEARGTARLGPMGIRGGAIADTGAR
jgi:hypothetical protein